MKNKRSKQLCLGKDMIQVWIVWPGQHKKKHLQVQHLLQKGEGQTGTSKHGDMLDDKQGRDVGPQFWSYFCSKKLTYPSIFHPFSLHLSHFDVYLISIQVFNFNFSISKVFMKIWFFSGKLADSEIPVIALWLMWLQDTWARIECMDGQLGSQD